MPFRTPSGLAQNIYESIKDEMKHVAIIHSFLVLMFSNSFVTHENINTV